MDLMDVFSQPAPTQPANSNVDVFASSNKPLAPSGQVPIGDPNAVLGSFYTQQAAPQ